MAADATTSILSYPMNARNSQHVRIIAREYKLPSVTNSRSYAEVGSEVGRMYIYIPTGITESSQTMWTPEDVSAIIQEAMGGKSFGDVMAGVGRQALSAVEGMAPGAVKNAESIAGAAFGKLLRPNDTLVLSEVGRYSIDFKWTLEPRDETEAKEISKIIKSFRKWSKPTLSMESAVGRQVLLYPPVFEIAVFRQISTTKAVSWKQDYVNNGEIGGDLFHYDNMVIEDFGVSYNGGANEALFYRDGAPISAEITLKFKSLRPGWNVEE